MSDRRLGPHSTGYLLAVTGLLFTPLPATAAGEPAFSVAPGQRQLFLDDHGIAGTENLTRTWHKPDKRGAVLRSSSPNMTIQPRSAPQWDPADKVYRLWTLGTKAPLRQSADGLHWIAGASPNMRTDQVVIDPRDPDPRRLFKATMTNRGFAVSPDGVNWTRLEVPVVQSFDEANFSYDPTHGLFIHTVKRTGPYGRSVAIAHSRNFKNWTDLGVVFHADETDQVIGKRRILERKKNPRLQQTEYDVPSTYSIQIYNMGVFHYEGLYIGLPSIYHHTGRVPKTWPGFDKQNLSPEILKLVRMYGDYTGFYNIQVAWSRDLKTWTRDRHRPTFLETSPLGAGAYDTQTIIGPSAPVVRDAELWFYYTGIRSYAFVTSGSVPGYADYRPDSGAVCLAILRRDGFVSLDAGNTTGTLTTRPFQLPDGRLTVNVHPGKGGQLTIDLPNKNNKALATSKPITTNQFRGTLEWAAGDPGKLTGQTVSLRIRFRRARLYSYWFQPPAG